MSPKSHIEYPSRIFTKQNDYREYFWVFFVCVPLTLVIMDTSFDCPCAIPYPGYSGIITCAPMTATNQYATYIHTHTHTHTALTCPTLAHWHVQHLRWRFGWLARAQVEPLPTTRSQSLWHHKSTHIRARAHTHTHMVPGPWRRCRERWELDPRRAHLQPGAQPAQFQMSDQTRSRPSDSIRDHVKRRNRQL